MIQTKKIILTLSCVLAGVFILTNWYYSGEDSIWFYLDKNTFFFFNQLIENNLIFRYIVAITNLRMFDAVGFLAMFLILFSYYLKADKPTRHFIICMGITILLTAVLVKQFNNFINIHRASPTLYFKEQGLPLVLVSELTGLPAKDTSGSCFPGDHGMCLIIFCLFMLRYMGSRAFILGLTVVVLFSLPRIMGGAHWLTDVLVGAVSCNLIVVSVVLLSPISDRVISGFMKLFHWSMPA